MQSNDIKAENRQARTIGFWTFLIGVVVGGYLVFLPIYDVLQGETTVSYSPFGIYLFLFTFSSGMMMLLFGARGRDFLSRWLVKNWITTGLYVLLILAVGYYIQFILDGWFTALNITNYG
jgi:hypothetical protein